MYTKHVDERRSRLSVQKARPVIKFICILIRKTSYLYAKPKISRLFYPKMSVRHDVYVS